jgi:hypothetical protein
MACQLTRLFTLENEQNIARSLQSLAHQSLGVLRVALVLLINESMP